MKEYNYPDVGDKLTTMLIEEKSDVRYWEESEKNILQMMIDEIRKMSNKPVFLDLGCGIGRLFSIFFPYVENITGIEPDVNRFEEALKEAKKIDKDKISVLNGDISIVENEKYDVVLVSHIFQHITMDSLEKNVHMLSQMISQRGLLYITTTFSGKERDIFSIEYLENNKRVSKIVNEEEFNNSFYRDEILPVRFYSINTIKKILEKNNFIIEKKVGYHFTKRNKKEKLTVFLDDQLNKMEDIEFARDILFICRKVKNIHNVWLLEKYMI